MAKTYKEILEELATCPAAERKQLILTLLGLDVESEPQPAKHIVETDQKAIDSLRTQITDLMKDPFANQDAIATKVRAIKNIQNPELNRGRNEPEIDHEAIASLRVQINALMVDPVANEIAIAQNVRAIKNIQAGIRPPDISPADHSTIASIRAEIEYLSKDPVKNQRLIAVASQTIQKLEGSRI